MAITIKLTLSLLLFYFLAY